jgi:poly-gamma-glutamate synthesis protein (capsule biosynthesis protein)
VGPTPSPSRDRRLRGAAAFALATLLGCGGAGGSAPLAPPEDPAVLVVTFVGDTTGHELVMAADDPDPLAGAGDLVGTPDVLVLNHEGVLVAGPHEGGDCAPLPGNTLLDAHPRFADFLSRAPTTVATLANNHALDCGADGLAATKAALEARGLLVAGAGVDADEACAPRRFRANGVDVSVLAYLAYPDAEAPLVAAGDGVPGVATWGTCDGASLVAEEAASGAFVVVCLHLHLGPSGIEETVDAHRTLVHQVLAAGADLVVAHGPHVPQGVFAREGKVGLMSLGNFVFAPGYPLDGAMRDVVTATVSLHAAKTVVTLHPGVLDEEGRPAPAGPDDAARILRDLARLSLSEGTVLTVLPDRAYVVVER